RREVRKQAHIGFDLRPDPGALDLEHHGRPVLQGRPVNLDHRSGSERGGVHLVEELFEGRSQVVLDLLTNLFEIDGRRLRLKLLNPRDPLRAEQVRARREDLAELDEGRPERLETPAHTLWTLEMRDVLGVLPPPHEPAGTLAEVLETHLLKEI